jgi:hypothetical protein
VPVLRSMCWDRGVPRLSRALWFAGAEGVSTRQSVSQIALMAIVRQGEDARQANLSRRQRLHRRRLGGAAQMSDECRVRNSRHVPVGSRLRHTRIYLATVLAET